MNTPVPAKCRGCDQRIAGLEETVRIGSVGLTAAKSRLGDAERRASDASHLAADFKAQLDAALLRLDQAAKQQAHFDQMWREQCDAETDLRHDLDLYVKRCNELESRLSTIRNVADTWTRVADSINGPCSGAVKACADELRLALTEPGGRD